MKSRAFVLFMMIAGIVGAQDCPCPRCVNVPEVKKTTKTVYDWRCIEYCSPRWALGDWFCHRKPDCGECGTLRTKLILIKYTCGDEKPVFKCVPASEAVAK